MPEEASLSVEIKNVSPVELDDLSASLHGLGDEYKRWLARNEDATSAMEVRLYVKEIRSGSIIADLVAAAPLALPFVEHVNSVMGFGAYLHTVYSWLLDRGKKPDEQLEKVNYENLAGIVEPVAKDAGSQLNIGTLKITGGVQITINSVEANAVQNRAKREAEKLKEPTSEPKEKVVLYWYQARNDPKARTGDKAIIESIHPGPVKALCVNESVKTKMLFEVDNPFTHAFVVDVTVETVRGRPALYRILDVHEQLDLPSVADEK